MRNYMIKKIFARQFQAIDIVALILTMVLMAVSARFATAPEELRTRHTDLSLGYIGRSHGDLLYAIDEGHSRLIAFDREGKEQFRIQDPSDEWGLSLYIDDFTVTEDALYLTASEWNGMLLDRELILRYSLSGEPQEIVSRLKYIDEEERTNKHRIYGIDARDGYVRWAECRADEILVHRLPEGAALLGGEENIDSGQEETVRLPYPNAFNAVSDLVFEGDDLIILNKNGNLERFDPTGGKALLYSASWAGEEDRIPFRIAVFGGKVYFTDLRGRCVVEADSAAQTGKVIADNTGSQTVAFSEDGGEMFLTDADGFHVISTSAGGDRLYLRLSKSREDLLGQTVFLISVILTIPLLIFLVIRLVIWMRSREHDRTRIVSLLVISGAAGACVIISTVLIGAFRESYMNKIREQLVSTGYIVASGIAQSDLESVQRAPDFDSDAYARICEEMEHDFPLNVDFYQTTYCNILRKNANDEGGYGMAYLDQSIGVYFPLDEVEAAEVSEVYATKRPVWNDEVLDVSGTYLSVKIPIMDGDRNVIGVAAVGADTFVVEKMILEMQRQVLMSIVVILLLLWVLSTEVIAFMIQRAACISRSAKENRQAMPGHLVRLLIFLVFGAFNMVSAFLPVFILDRSRGVPLAWRGLAASLPVTINIFVMGIMALFCANLVRKLGVRKIFMISMGFSMCGNLILFLVPGYAPVIAGLVLDGIGVGLISNAMYVALTYLPDEEERQSGFTSYNAASLAGINFGMLSGGALAVNLGQRNVFLVVALMWAALIVFGSLLARRLEKNLQIKSDDVTEDSRVSAAGFVRARPIWTFIAFVQNPCIVFNSFVFFFVPIYCSRAGYNETIISLFLMLYSQLAVMLGESLPAYVDRTLGDRGVYLAMGLNVIAVAAFVLTGNTPGLVLALIILGVSASFSKPSQQEMFLRQRETVQYGEDKAMGIYNFSENIGESLGPVIFGNLMVGPLVWVWSFLGAVVACGALHFGLNRKDRSDAG